MLLGFLADYELASTSQVAEEIFIAIDRRTVLRRLRKLERQKLIKRTRGLESGEFVWSLAALGAASVGRTKYLDHINKNSLAHDIGLTDQRLRFERVGLASGWVTEQALRRALGGQKLGAGDEVTPDAVFAVKTNSGYEAIGFELELSPKNLSRYTKLFKAYSRQKKFLLAWYVVENAAFGRRLAKHWKHVCPTYQQRPQFAWSLKSDLLKDVASAAMHIETKSFRLDQLFEFKSSAHTRAVSVGTPHAKNCNEIALSSAL
jgi:DNA-binding Lrp family transcriptional regulator